ncbi:MAG: hypothetical protein OXE05_03760 [Chloroflexi bacterium]|nr:hypothetical protein [Chloroflexota bacterium]
MLLKFLNWLFSTSNDSVVLQQSQSRPQDSQVIDDSTWSGVQDGNWGTWDDDQEEEDTDEYVFGYEIESDWDEYGDEIAGAVAFASWQEKPKSGRDWDEDEADLAAGAEDSHEYVERWEDWAAVDEVEDDESYQWSEEEVEEY